MTSHEHHHNYEKLCSDDIEEARLHNDIIHDDINLTDDFKSSVNVMIDKNIPVYNLGMISDSLGDAMIQFRIIIALGWPNCIERYVWHYILSDCHKLYL